MQIAGKTNNLPIINLLLAHPKIEIKDFSFYNCNELTEISIPSSISFIGDKSFYNCSSLKKIMLPSSITKIGNYAFYNCYSLINIFIPSSVISIGSCAFEKCPDILLHSYNNNDIGVYSYSIYFIDRKHLIISDKSAGIDEFVKPYISDIQKVTIYPLSKSIRDNGFEKCSSLNQVEFLSKLTMIGNYAFSQCFSLQKIDIPQSVTSIGKFAFFSCPLIEISIPREIIKINESTFEKCSSLKKVEIPSSVK